MRKIVTLLVAVATMVVLALPLVANASTTVETVAEVDVSFSADAFCQGGEQPGVVFSVTNNGDTGITRWVYGVVGGLNSEIDVAPGATEEFFLPADIGWHTAYLNDDTGSRIATQEVKVLPCGEPEPPVLDDPAVSCVYDEGGDFLEYRADWTVGDGELSRIGAVDATPSSDTSLEFYEGDVPFAIYAYNVDTELTSEAVTVTEATLPSCETEPPPTTTTTTTTEPPTTTSTTEPPTTTTEPPTTEPQVPTFTQSCVDIEHFEVTWEGGEVPSTWNLVAIEVTTSASSMYTPLVGNTTTGPLTLIGAGGFIAYNFYVADVTDGGQTGIDDLDGSGPSGQTVNGLNAEDCEVPPGTTTTTVAPTTTTSTTEPPTTIAPETTPPTADPLFDTVALPEKPGSPPTKAFVIAAIAAITGALVAWLLIRRRRGART